MIWDFQDALTRRLLLWSAASVVAGVTLLLWGDAFWRGVGLQAVAWGAIDAGIALAGRRSANKRVLKQAEKAANAAELAEFAAREAHSLRRLLWINTGLDVLYVAGGAALALTLGRSDEFARGNGWGIVVQGGFLFLFDLLHALTVPAPAPSLPWTEAFSGPEHRPFTLEGGTQAAVLLHGFLGTPAEMRGLGEALNEQGWTVHAPLLPGFGGDVETLTERRWQEWAAAVRRASDELKRQGHDPLLLVGYSMGGALALAEAAKIAPQGLALLAPLYWPEPWWLPPVEFVVRPFLPLGFRPMRKADFDDPRVRQGIENFMPGIDLGDPQVQAAVRSFRVPLGLIDQLRGVSRAANGAARNAEMPVFVVQGARDRVVRPERTARLTAKLPRRPEYVEVDSDHALTEVAVSAWPEVRQALLAFAAGVLDGTPAGEGPR
jgi:carboxylesterase